MADKGKALNQRRPLVAAPIATSAKPPSASALKAPLNRLVIACVGCGTLATAVGHAWRAGHGAGQAPGLATHSLILGLEIDLAAGAAALAVGLWLAARLERRADAATATVATALADMATDPDPHRLKPLDAAGDQAQLARGYNDALAALVRRERQLALHAMAQGEKTRLSELALLRQDISAPLTTVKSLARGLAQDGAASEAAQRGRRMALAVSRVGESVLATLDDLTHRASASTKGFDVHPSPVDLAEIMDDVCALLWTEAEAKGVDLAAYIDPKTPLEIQADPVRLRQIIGGLAGSALAATCEGGVLIEVEPDSPTSIRISVHTTGPALGRPPDAEPGGDSLGPDARPGDPDANLSARMAIYRQMVKAMGGAFTAPTQRDRGASVAFRLPAQIGGPAMPWAGAPDAPPLAASGVARRPRTLHATGAKPLSGSRRLGLQRLWRGGASSGRTPVDRRRSRPSGFGARRHSGGAPRGR